MGFFKSLIKKMLDEGHSVDIATNETDSKVDPYYIKWGCQVYQMSWTRSPFKVGNLQAIKQLKKILKEHHYDAVHCHTPIAAACTRLACRKFRKKGLKVFYTAHGFHFFHGAPIKNWLVYYPIEKICAHWTDILITINQEDYKRAKRKLHARHVEYVPGVGIDIDKFSHSQIDRDEKRAELGIGKQDFLFLSVGELSIRKNHEAVIKALKEIDIAEWKYLIAGEGSLKTHLKNLAESLGVGDQVFLLGQRNDIAELCACSDLFVFPSLQEGLPVALMEAIASKTPVLCSKIRGNVELVDESQTFSATSIAEITNAIQSFLSQDDEKRKELIEKNYSNLSQYSIANVNDRMLELYSNVINI